MLNSWTPKILLEEYDARLFKLNDGVPSGYFYPTGVLIYIRKDAWRHTYVLPLSDRTRRLYSNLPEGSYVEYSKYYAGSSERRYYLEYNGDIIGNVSIAEYKAQIKQLKTSADGQVTKPLDVEFIQIK